jgi:hypothetical protein
VIDSTFLYIDPGTGSAIIAMVLGAMAGISMYVRTKWQSIRHRLSK